MTRRRVAAALGLLAGIALVLWLFAEGDDDEPRRSPTPAAPAETQPAERGEDGGRPERRCAPSPGRLEVAIQDNAGLLQGHYGYRDQALRQIKELGASWLKASLVWNLVAPRPDSQEAPEEVDYDFSEHDALLDAADQHGLCMELAVMGPAPAWASDGALGVQDPDRELFAEFARAAAEHFRGRVARYSIWNEPNHAGWIRPLAEGPETYRGLYEAGYAAIEEVDPGAQVLIGETAPYARPGEVVAPLEFLRELTCLDRDYQPVRECEPLEADGYAHHAYDFDHPPDYVYPGRDNVTIGTVDRLAEALDRVAEARALLTPDGRPLPIYLTEFGYFASGRRRIPAERRAEWLPQAFEIARRNPRVRQMLQYLFYNPPPDHSGASFNTGIVHLDGRPGPAYRALAEWAERARERGQLAAPAGP
jgi:hypothetical protein